MVVQSTHYTLCQNVNHKLKDPQQVGRLREEDCRSRIDMATKDSDCVGMSGYHVLGAVILEGIRGLLKPHAMV